MDYTNTVTIPDCSTTTNLFGVFNCGGLPSHYINVECTKDGPSYSQPEWVDGVSTLDIIRIQKHILGIDYFTSQYKKCAADANFDGIITTSDLLKIQKLILGNIQEFPDYNAPWQFFSEFYCENPTYAPFFNGNGTSPSAFAQNYMIPQVLTAGNTVTVEYGPNTANYMGFNMIKIGDVNDSNSQAPSFTPETVSSREATNVLAEFNIGNKIKQGDLVSITISIETNDIITGYQLGLTLSPEVFEIIDVQPGDMPNLSKKNLGIKDIINGHIKTLWWDDNLQGKSFDATSPILTITAKIITPLPDISSIIGLDDRLLKPEFYTLDSKLEDAIVNIEISSSKFLKSNIDVVCTPNPFVDEVSFIFGLIEDCVGKVSVYNNSGKILFTYEQLFNQGINHCKLKNAFVLPKGMFYFSIETKNQLLSGKIIKI